MEDTANSQTTSASAAASATDMAGNDGAFGKKLTALELNAIKLDVQHTVLTPEYLENAADPAAPQKSGA